MALDGLVTRTRERMPLPVRVYRDDTAIVRSDNLTDPKWSVPSDYQYHRWVNGFQCLITRYAVGHHMPVYDAEVFCVFNSRVSYQRDFFSLLEAETWAYHFAMGLQ